MSATRTPEELRKAWPQGTRVRLVSMDDPQAPRVGTLGTVLFIDDASDIHVRWDTGSSLAILDGIDVIERV